MIPGDGNFLHYDSEAPSAKTNGRIYVLKFQSSSQRYLFWLQSAPEHPTIHSRLSERDRKITDIVFNLLQGEEVDVDAELAALDEDDDEEEEEEEYEDEDEDEDEEMADQTTTARGTTGGAGADATGGDIRDEGEDAREGGADGGRATTETTANVDSVVRNLLASLEGSRQLSDSPRRPEPNDKPFPFLSHLLPTSVTVPIIDSGVSEEKIDQLINLLPPTLVVATANSGTNSAEISQDPTAEMLESAKASLSLADKRDLVKRVLRSPQFAQSLGSLTMAIRDGGLPTIAEALQIDVENNGYMRGSAMPLGNATPSYVKMAAHVELNFPTDKSQFDSDDRISFSKLDQKYIAVHDDGDEYEFDEAAQHWVLCDEGDEGDEPPLPQNLDPSSKALLPSDMDSMSDTRKRKEAPTAADNEDSNKQQTKPRAQKKAKGPLPPRKNTAVYVTGIPNDATLDEIHDLFSRKGGVVAEEIDSGRPRIKMYTDVDGNFKGDALIVFFKPQSVEMAIMLLDDTDFRFTSAGKPEGRIRVQEADSSYKKTKYEGKQDQQGGNKDAQAPTTRKNDQDRHKIIKKTQKLELKLADWDDDQYPPDKPVIKARWEKTVILSHMFTLKELEEDPTALLDIKEDIRDECSKLGTVTNVILFDMEPEGIVSVKFKEIEAAHACVRMMHGRNFGGQVVEAGLATGKEKFKQSSKASLSDSDSD
ncbi:Splicing factor U2AF-associated protein 2 [Ceratocystis lukuohia]|uniref:Splicing factor U2AF-associated protein 2 n=1 Tax=Ceratocystis lukuohia TaxID=2019550 RepID=A0ABR4MAK8_9PEZI